MLNYRTRTFFGTINYPKFSLVKSLMDIFHEDSCTYYIIGFEGCAKRHHRHIHFVCHFKNARHIKAFQKQLNYNFRNEYPVKEVTLAIEYCKGYEKGDLKCSHCSHDTEVFITEKRSCNVYFEMGMPPVNGVKKDNITTQVVNAIRDDGATLDQIRDLYPSYYIHHSRKLKEYINEVRPKSKDPRTIYVILAIQLYDFAEPGDFIDPDINTYNNEYDLFQKFEIVHFDNWIPWLNGFPKRIRRGYEIIELNPTRVFLMISSVVDLREIRKIYSDKISYQYIENVL